MVQSPLSNFYVNTHTATDDAAFRLEDNPGLVLKSCNIHVYTNPAYYGNMSALPGIVQANSVMWFDAPIRPFDLMFKNYTPGSNTTIVITGPLY